MHQNNISGINIVIMCLAACISMPFVNAQAYQISDIISLENLDFPVNSNPAASDAFLDGKITATACQLGDYRSVPTPSLIASGTEYGIRKMNLHNGNILFQYKTSNGREEQNSVIYTLNNPHKLKSVAVMGLNTTGKWNLYGRIDSYGPFGPNMTYGLAVPGRVISFTEGKESQFILDEAVSNAYKWYCFVPCSNSNYSYVKFSWEVDATDPELEYYGTPCLR